MSKLFLALVLLTFSGIHVSAQTARAIEAKLLQRLAVIEKHSNYGPTSDYDKLGPANDLFKRDLAAAARTPAVMAYAFPRLAKKMQIVTSKDGRLRIFSWDRETGGTMHDFDSVYHFRGTSGKIAAWTSNDDDESAGAFYHDLYQIDSRSGPIYLAVSTFIGSTSLHGASIDLLKIDRDRLVHDAKLIRTSEGLTSSISFGYDFFSVVDRPERPVRLFKFDAVRKSFSFPVVIEDEKTPQGRVTNRMITYRFNGEYFVKLS